MIVPSAGVSSLSDLPALTASRALVSNASGVIDVSAATSTELGYLSGVTSAIQTQLNAKAATTHQHSAADVTSGTLATAQGGRGRGNYTAANRVPYAASTTAETDSASLTFNGTTFAVGSCAFNSNGTFNVTGASTWQVAAWDVLKYVSGNGVRFGGVTSSQWSQVECYASGSEVMRWTSGGLIIGGTSINAAARFQIDSTTQGMLPPRHTSAQRAAVSTPPEGLFVHDTTDSHPYVRSNAAWRRIAFTTDNYFGANASAVNTSYAFGDGYTADTYELVFGVVQDNTTKPQVKLKKQGLFHYPDEGWAASLDRWTQNVHLSLTTNDNTPTGMDVDENIGGADGIDIPVDHAAVFDGLVIGVDTSNYETGSYQIKGVIKNVGGTTTLVSGTVTVIQEADAAWDCTLSADDTADELIITVTGDSTNQVRWSASVRMSVTSMTAIVP